MASESWLERAGGLLGYLWQSTICGVLNLRRRLFKRRLPDYVVLTLDADLLEREPDVPWYYTFLPIYSAPLSLETIAGALRRVAVDPDVKGVLFLFKGATLSLAQAQSLASLCEHFRGWDRAQHGHKAGFAAKQVVAHLEEVTAATFVAACAADRITLAPLAEWDVTGLLATPTFFKDLLARLGVEFDVVRVAPWKTAADSFLFNGLTDAAREQYNWLFDSLFGTIVGAVAGGRNLPEQMVRDLVDRAPLGAAAALAAGLVDQVLYEDELPALLGQAERPARCKAYGRVRGLLRRQPRRSAACDVGVISLIGSIMTGESRSFPVALPILGEETIGSSTAQQLIRRARQDDSLGAVIVHVDSPGGSALASDLIWRELVLLNQEKPLIVYMGDVAASGGYYIAAPGRQIVAQPATITGSIGVIMAKPVTAGAFKKLGVGWDTVQRGAHADLASSLTPWEGEPRQAVEESLQHYYGAFKQRVAEGRKLPLAAVDDLAGGRVWTGEQALAKGLVDHLGDFERAIELACVEAGLPTDGRVRVVPVAAGGRWLAGEPRRAVEVMLGLAGLRQVAGVVDLLAGGEFARLLARERVWLLADMLPRIRF